MSATLSRLILLATATLLAAASFFVFHASESQAEEPVIANEGQAEEPAAPPEEAKVQVGSLTQLSEELAEGLRRLGNGDLLPEHRTQWVERFSDPEVPLSAADLSQLFLVGGSHNAHVDGARIALARLDPALIPLMFEAFLNSKITRSTFDPDIFERLLRGLQSFPLAEVRSRLSEAELDFVADASRERLSFDWLEPLALNNEGMLGELDARQKAASVRTTRRWLDELLRPGNHGLTRLQTDSGDVAFHLFRRLEAQHLGVLIETGSSEEARVALEVAVQRQLGTPEVREALAARLEREPDGELMSLSKRLQNASPPVTLLYPVGSIETHADSTDWLLAPSKQRSYPVVLIVASVLLIWLLLSLLLATLWPRLRSFLFPLAAVILAVLSVVLVELGLGAVGFQPLMDVRPAFNPNRAPPELFTETLLEGTPYIVNLEGNSRQLAFPRDKGAGVQRVVTLGESSVHGTHYLYEESFSAVLEEELNKRSQEKRVEVINAGVGGALSDEIVHYARQSYVLEPDLLVMYFGNNDLADLMRLAEYRAWSPASVALRFILDRVRLVRLISMALPAQALNRVVAGGAWLDHEGLSETESRLLRKLSELNLRVNMERIVLSAEAQGIPTILALQAQNDDMCGPTDERDQSFHSGCFQQALRRVALKVGARTGVPVVDIPQALRFHEALKRGEATEPDTSQVAASPLEIRREGAGHSYFYDTCHPTRLGHRLIGERLAPVALHLLND